MRIRITLLSVIFLLLISSLSVYANCASVSPSFSTSVTDVCGAGATSVSFTNNSTGSASTTATYKWYKNGVLFDTKVGLIAPSNSSISAIGTYSFMLVATDNSIPCSDTTIVNVAIHPVPSASFTFTNNQCAKSNVSFTNTSTGLDGYTTYSWNFGDGKTSTASNPSHAFVSGATYTVQLIVSNGPGCTDIYSTPVTIKPLIPNLNISGNDGDGDTRKCVQAWQVDTNDFVTFTNSSTNATGYTWDFGDGSPIVNTTTADDTSHLFATFGTYNVVVTASGSNGCNAIDTIVVIFEKDIDIGFSTPGSACEQLTISPTNNTLFATTFTWDFGDGSATETTTNITAPSHTYTCDSAKCTYTVRLTAANSCVSKNSTVDVDVYAKPTARFTTNLPGYAGCESQTVNFYNASQYVSPVNNYFWDFGGGDSLRGVINPPSKNFAAGLYPVMIVAGNNCGIDTTYHTIRLTPNPTINVAVSNDTGCVGMTVNFTNTSSTGSSYFWDFGDDVADTSSILYQPPPVTFIDSGRQMITFKIDTLGCVVRDTFYVEVSPIPTVTYTVSPNEGCSPLQVTFTNTSPVNVGDTYLWDFDNGNTSTNQNPSDETFTTTTTDSIYNTKLIITSSYACQDSTTVAITAHPNPAANFTINKDTVCANENIIFTNTSVDATSYYWDFGDGNNSTAASPTRSYSSAGNYTVTMIANTLYNCSDTAYAFVVVDPVSIPNFNATTVCIGDSTAFTDLSVGNIISWEWDFDDGSAKSNLTNPSHLYATDNTYSVKLTTINDKGCSNEKTKSVFVNPIPVADFSSNIACLGNKTTFTDITNGSPISWDWDFGDGSPSGINQNPTHTYSNSGTFTVTLIASSGSGCFDITSKSVLVNPTPTANFIYTAVCSSDTTRITSTSTGNPNTYYWDFGDGNTDNTNNPKPWHIYTQGDTNDVMLVAGYAATGCKDTTILPLITYPRTIPGFTNNTACFGTPTQFTDTSKGVPTAWLWRLGDGVGSNTTSSPVYSYTDSGSFAVTLITTNSYMCSDSITNNVVVSSIPTANFTFDSVCAGFATNFTDSSLAAISWAWNFVDGSPIDSNASTSHIFPLSGNYNVSQLVSNSIGCKDSITKIVVVYPNPTAKFTASKVCNSFSTQFFDASLTAISWLWDYGDGSSIDSTQYPSHIFPKDSVYNTELVVSNSYGCTDTALLPVSVLPQPIAAFNFNQACALDVVQFTDVTTKKPTSWSWNFGDGSPAATMQNPSHTFNLAGDYTIRLIASNDSGCTDTNSVTTTIFTIPIPNFTFDTACLGDVTTFTDQSTDSVNLSSFYWDFGDGNNSISQNPLYIYQSAGTFNVKLRATNVNGCDSSISKPVIVYNRPKANFNVDTVCKGDANVFTDLSTGTPTSWLWDFGDGTTSTQKSPTHTYINPGGYAASLTATAGNGCSDQFIKAVKVLDVAQAAFTVSDSVCMNSSLAFYDNSSTTTGTITAYLWKFGDGVTSTQKNPTHTYTLSGTYMATLFATSDSGCTDTVAVPITVNPLPIVAFSATTACEQQATLFTDNSTVNNGTIKGWQWNFGDGATATLQHPTHNYATQGNYNVSLAATSISGCIGSASQPVTIRPKPLADFIAGVACFGNSTSFSDISTVNNGTIDSWQWNFGDGSTDTIKNPTHIFTTYNDSFTVQLITTSNYSCVDTLNKVIVIKLVDFNFVSLTSSGCNPFTVSFLDASSVSDGVTSITNWEWDFDDGNKGIVQNPTHTYTQNGNYYVSLTVTSSDGCTYSTSLNYPVQVFAQPVAAFEPNPPSSTMFFPEIEFINQSIDALSWNWDFGDSSYSTSFQPTHTYQDTGTFYITLISSNQYGCFDTTTNSVKIEGEFTFYIPNAFTPDGDGVNDKFSGKGFGILEYHLMIFNRWESDIYETNDINKGWDGTTNNSNELVKNGVYIYKINITDIFQHEHEYIGHVTVVR